MILKSQVLYIYKDNSVAKFMYVKFIKITKIFDLENLGLYSTYTFPISSMKYFQQHG